MEKTKYSYIKEIKRGSVLSLPQDDILSLLNLADKHPSQRAKIFIHNSSSDLVQEMIIASTEKAYTPPHRQIGLNKSYYLVEGEMSVLFFNSDNKKIDKKVYELNKQFPIIHFDAGIWHSVLMHKPTVYIEVIAGPYNPDKTDFMQSCPNRDEVSTGVDFLKKYFNENQNF